MKYEVIDRGDELSAQLAEQFHQLAEKFGLTRDPEQPDVVVSIGGDGTMLHAFHQYVEQLERISFVGIHTGHLGFYADWKPAEIELLARSMAEHSGNLECKIVKYPLVQLEIRSSGDANQSYLVLNEFTLKGDESTLVSQVHINGEMFEMFRGDGICISTPSGSTAYNKSVGGAILHPALDAIQIAEIASINNRVFRTLGSSIVLPKHHHCDIYPKEGHSAVITLDHIQMKQNDIVSIRCMVSDKKVRFARFRTFPFWNRVKEAFIGEHVQ